MKTQISRYSFRPQQRYSGVRLQQGRMIVDADWNELGDIVGRQLAAALGDAVDSGAPRSGGLELVPGSPRPLIRPGRLYVDGVAAELAGPAAGVALRAQTEYPNAPTLPAGNLRFYADVWERSVTALEDPDLMDPGLHGADTASRTQTMLQVKWCAAGVNPANAAANPDIGNAALSLRLRTITSAGDPCDPCAAEVEVDERIGNYLFRVEVHDVYVSGGATRLVLKWSRDNGAEAYPANQVPAGFSQGNWVWEFFDAATEKQLGNHLSPAGFRARRGLLRESFAVPTDAGDPKDFVRQWDGYAEINLNSSTLVDGRDRGADLRTDGDADAPGKVSFAAGAVSMNLDLLKLELELSGRRFVAGDYWLGTVREAVHGKGDLILDRGLPVGVRHHYLELGQSADGTPLPPPGVTADAWRRRMHFPPLTDLHADEVAYSPPAGCSGLYGSAVNVKQALDELCNIDARDIGYTLDCAPGNTVASLLAGAVAGWPNLDGQPKSPSVQDMLSALLCHLTAARLPYTVHTCAGTPNVAQALGLTAGGETNVAEVLRRFLCELDAKDIPLDRNALTCQDLKDSGETSVQGALDYLCATRITRCAITVPVGQLETLLRAFAADASSMDLWLCLMPGAHVIGGAALNIAGKHSLRLSAAAAAGTTVHLSTQPATWSADELGLEGVRFRIASTARLNLKGKRIVATRCSFTRSSASDSLPPMVRLDPLGEGSEMVWRDNLMTDTWSRPAGGTGPWFRVETVGNAAVAAAFEGLLADATVVEDDEAFQKKAEEVAAIIVENMSGAERLAWRDNINKAAGGAAATAPPPPAPPPSAPAKRALGGAGAATEAIHFTRAGGRVGVMAVEEAAPAAAAALENIAVENDAGAIAGIIRDGLYEVLYETGYGVALALGSASLSGSLAGNHVNGELLLMNGQESGIDPAVPNVISRDTAVLESPLVQRQGRLRLEGNRIARLWARLPANAVDGHEITRLVPGYDSLVLSGNVLEGYGHSLVAYMLSATGNHFDNGPPRSPTLVGRFYCARAALSGNLASFADDFTPLRVFALEMEAAANLIAVQKG